MRTFFYKVFLHSSGFFFIPKTFLNFYSKYKDIQFVYLIGLPRSGTSVLLKKINSHRKVCMFYEPMKSSLMYGRKSIVKYVPFYEFDKNLVHLHGIQGNDYIMFGEKTIFGSSKFLEIIIFLKLSFDAKSKFILFSRDPRSRYLSYKRWIAKRNKSLTFIKSQFPKSIQYETNRWINFSKLCIRFKGKKNVIFLNYENMISNPNNFFQQLGDFLKLNLNSIVVDDLFTSSLDKWKSELLPDEIEYIESKTYMFNKK